MEGETAESFHVSETLTRKIFTVLSAVMAKVTHNNKQHMLNPYAGKRGDHALFGRE